MLTRHRVDIWPLPASRLLDQPGEQFREPLVVR
jgi:hypothetical protein